MPRICVFCGSRPGSDPAYLEAATLIGRMLAERGIGLVYGGGSRGMMGAVADAALAAGGEVIGVIPRGLFAVEAVHRAITEVRAVDTLLERKSLMAELSDGFLTLPGGIGTLDELFEMWTWKQLRIHRKPCAIFNVRGYYDGLLAFADRLVAGGYLGVDQRAIPVVGDDPEALLQALLEPR
jgi:uncharacterized protein (TIGR00730 family)